MSVTNRESVRRVSASWHYFRSTAQASPFESWLAQMLEEVAAEDMRYGWQHPDGVRRLADDRSAAPSRRTELQEDMGSVDPTHVEPTGRGWQGTSRRIMSTLTTRIFSATIRGIRRSAIRRVISTPTPAISMTCARITREFRWSWRNSEFLRSRGLAHRSPAGWNQGMHTEAEQGEIDAAMMAPSTRKGMTERCCSPGRTNGTSSSGTRWTWNNHSTGGRSGRTALPASAFSGCWRWTLPRMAPGVTLDGRAAEWAAIPHKREWQYPALDLAVSHDEAYVYLMLRKRSAAWDFSRDQLYVGFRTLPGGARLSDQAPGLTFSEPVQFMLRIRSSADARWFVLSAYDQHTYRWSIQHPLLPSNPDFADSSLGIFLPWKLLLSRPLVLPDNGEEVPAEEVEIGLLKRGTTDRLPAATTTWAIGNTRGTPLKFGFPGC